MPFTPLKLLALFIFVLIAQQATAQEHAPYPGGTRADLWILAGQSNMAGNGVLKEPIAPDPRIMLFNMDNRWMEAQEPLHRLFESVAPVHKRIFLEKKGMTDAEFEARREQSRREPLGRVGPGLFFAKHLVQMIDAPVGLIACAHGGTTMRQWDPALKELGNDSLYGAMLQRIATIGQPVKGLLWYQGESEAMEPSDAEIYDRLFCNLIENLRRDTGQPDLPVIFVQIGRWTRLNDPRGASWEKVRELQRQVARSQQNVWMVPAADLSLDDEIHISFEGQQRLGQRLAEVALGEVYRQSGRARPLDLESIEVMDPQSDRPTIRVRFSGVSGRLIAPGRADGFEIRFPAASEPTGDIYRVDFDPADPAALLLRLARPLQTPASLVYAPGMNPHVNITDERDMALPAFGPIELTW